MKLDKATKMVSKARHARVVVEVNLSKPQVPGTDVTISDSSFSPFWQSFEYEHVHLYCKQYDIISH